MVKISAGTRFGTSGVASSSFGGEAQYSSGIAIQSDGKIVIYVGLLDGSDNELGLARFNTDGTLDSTFGTIGPVATDAGLMASP